MAESYDVIIVGDGPAGIFAALELSQMAGLSILLIEKGKDISERQCPVRDVGGSCIECAPCNLVCGLGGAGAFSDGKLVLTPRLGGQLGGYLGEKNAEVLIKYVDDIYLKFGASERLYGVGSDINEISHRANRAGLHLIPTPVRHLGTENCYEVLKSMQEYLIFVT